MTGIKKDDKFLFHGSAAGAETAGKRNLGKRLAVAKMNAFTALPSFSRHVVIGIKLRYTLLKLMSGKINVSEVTI